MTVDLRYVGPFDQVRVPLPTGGELHAEHGGVITVPDDLAPGLLDQPTNWTAIVDADDATVADLRAELERRGIAHDPKAKKADLVAALAEADDPPAPPDPDTDPADHGDAN
jgi:hypothetical protein